MRAIDALKQSLKHEFVPTLRAAGFAGTYPTWRLRADDAVAVVNVQAGQNNEGTHGTFAVNLAVVPRAWWEWTHDESAGLLRRSASAEGREQEYDGLLRKRLVPRGSRRRDHWWTINSVPEAVEAAGGMAAALRAGPLDDLIRFTDPDQLITHLRADTSRGWPLSDGSEVLDIAMAVMLSDHGDEDLDRACTRLDRLALRAEATAHWARERAALRSDRTHGVEVL